MQLWAWHIDWLTKGLAELQLPREPPEIDEML